MNAAVYLEVPSELQCPISLDLMTSPVKLLQTGQIYDHKEFAQWLKEGGSTDPMTNTPLQSPVMLRPMHSLREKIEHFARENAIELKAAEYGAVRFVSNTMQQAPPQEIRTRHETPAQSKLVRRLAKKFVAFLMSPGPVSSPRGFVL